LIVFVVLKLTDNIDWGWGWVLSPYWIPLGLVAGFAAVFFVVMMALGLFQAIGAKRRLSKQYKEHVSREP
jgi:hypothetical protein